MAQAKITLLGMYGYFESIGEDLFEFLSLPEGMNKQTFTDTLFLDYGERAVLYSNPDMLKRMIGAWSTKWSLELGRIASTLLDNYEPLYNIDRYEQVSDTANETTSGSLSESEGISGTLSATNGTTNSQTVENTRSAYNSSSYEPDNKSQIGGSTSENISQTSGSDKSLNQITGGQKNNTFAHTAHFYGNGGVTMSQQMVESEIKLRERYNLYHEACKLFSDDLLLYIY